MGSERSILGFVTASALVWSLAGCGVSIPTDPDATLNRIENGELRVGVAEEPDLAVVEGDRASGALVELLEGFATRNDAAITWSVGSEESLVGALERGEIDVAIGGMTSDSPWADRVGMTRGYAKVPQARGRELVLLVPMGENRLLSELERYLDREVG